MTRLIKLAISLLVYVASFCRDQVRLLRGRANKPCCVVLYYHIVESHQRQRFASQMDMLLRWCRPVSLDKHHKLENDVRYAAVTFDDAFESVLHNALPELERRGIPSTIFVISDVLGKEVGWEGYPGRTMSAEQLMALPSDRVRIGSHTVSHPLLTSLKEKEAKQELHESKVRLEQLLPYPITSFSFPYGAFNERLVQWCREAGYKRTFTTLPRLAGVNSNEFVIGRVSAEPSDWPLEFYLKLNGAYRWLPFAFTAKQKILALFGAVPNEGESPSLGAVRALENKSE